jgi:hypothetical protein
MMLLTKEVKENLPKLGATDGQPGPRKVAVKFFMPDGGFTWWAVEGEQMENGDWEFYGLVQGAFLEWGPFFLNELKQARGAFGLPVERDRNFSGYIDMDTNKIVRPEAA